MYKKEVLPNGIRIVTHGISNRESVSVGLWIGVGGRFESDVLKGAAHYLEHIVFKGTKKYGCEQIKESIEGVGGSLNAFTTEEQTCFYAKIPALHIKQTFDVLSDMVIAPKIAQKDMNKEKTVIVEEIKMYHDLPQYYVLELLDQLIWNGHPLGKGLAGSIETVSAMTSPQLRRFHQEHYGPENIVVAVSGQLDHKKVVAMVKSKMGSLKTRMKQEFKKVDALHSQSRVKFLKRDIEQMHVALGVPGYDEKHKDRYALSLLSIILGGNMSSRLFVELREKKGYGYSVSSCAKTLKDTGLFMIRAGVDNAKLVDAVDLILKELNKLKRKEVPAGEFKRAKDYLSGQLLLGLEDTMDHMLWIGESVISRNKVRTLKEVIKEFNKVRPSDIMRVAKELFDLKRVSLAIVGPIKSDQEQQLRALLKVVS